MVVALAMASICILGVFISSHTQSTLCEVEGMQRASLAQFLGSFGLEREQAWVIN